MLLTSLFPYLPYFPEPKTTSPGTVLPTIVLPYPHQYLIKKISCRFAYSQILRRNMFNWGLLLSHNSSLSQVEIKMFICSVKNSMSRSYISSMAVPFISMSISVSVAVLMPMSMFISLSVCDTVHP